MPTAGEQAPGFEALLCDGETFRERTLERALGDRGGVLVFFGFAFSAIAENWWHRYERAGWHEFDVPVYGVGRDGPYAMNAFLREIDSPFSLFADVDGEVAEAYDLLVERDGMAGVHTPRRAVYVLDDEGTVQHAWETDEWINPVPREEIEQAVESL
ncbi:peroxiredoxin family protein [Natronomonas sp. EA1]|uniref:peroxiredoxin family protein n=1 Tax=Natronomonas sp. EA1 TaxID=3421655 RepID=UPI003EBD6414